MPCSPAINTGDPSSTVPTGSTDIYNNIRLYGSRIDIGAVEVQSAPMVMSLTASSTTTINEGEEITLTASGSDRYRWSTDETTPSITVTPTISTTYTVNGLVGDHDQCDIQQSILIEVTPLPVNLISFTAQPHVNHSVKLEWTTTEEINNDYFEIERSTNLVTTQTIAQIKATEGHVHALRYYTQVDETPIKGLSYYRLVQVDQDGTRTSYDWKSVTLDQTYGIYPNPVTTGKFVLQLDEEKKVQLSLTNVEGNRIPFSRSTSQSYQTEIVLPKGITPGVYHLKVEERGRISVHKVMVQ